ncbi:MAG: hypothetical protein ACN4GZ_15485 [Acidimicrobiales bacterium]
MIGEGAKAVLLAAVVGFGYLVFGIVTAGDPQHRVDLELVEGGTFWPWQSSIQRASAVWINETEGQQWVGNATVEAREPENITQLELIATASSASEAQEGAEQTAQGFLTHDFNLQREPFQTVRDAVLIEITELRNEFEEQEQLVGQASNPSEITARSERLEGTAATIGRLEGDLNRLDRRLSASTDSPRGPRPGGGVVWPRYELANSKPVSPARERIPETLKLFGGVVIMGWLAQRIRSAGSKHTATLID